MSETLDTFCAACPDNDLDRAVAQEVFDGEAYPLPRLAPGVEINVVADIGAHIGMAAVYFRRRFPKAKIHCYEPCAETLGWLRRNVGEFAEIHEYGLFFEDRTATYTRKHDALAMTSIRAAGQKIGTLEMRNAWELIPLRPDIIKVDTEGCEVEIVETALPAFRTAKLVYVEYHRPEDRRTIDALLSASHLLFHGVTNGVNQGQLAYVRPECLTKEALEFNRL